MTKPNASQSTQRALLSKEMLALREPLVELLPILEAEPDWYGSVFAERKAHLVYTANFKQTQMSDTVSFGAVLRVYDGYTLYEQATDDLKPESLKAQAQELVKRARAQNEKPPAGEKRPYRPLTWKQRLSEKLENEIISQVPASPTPSTWVHFGIRFGQDPRLMGAGDWFGQLNGILENCRKLAHEEGLGSGDLTYAMARQGFGTEESLFVDRETRMSQTLFRLGLTIVAMSGADRTYLRLGGLGGPETVQVEERDLREAMRDLKALKAADRLQPGKYRVLFGPVLTGVLAHEAFGHSQEGDTCARGRSKAWELHRTGVSVGNTEATILNNPAIYENGPVNEKTPSAAWGSYFFDEEGWLAREQVLLDQGILKSPMTNLTSALRLGVPRTANGKRESWANGVYTRQTNTYFSAGKLTLDQIMDKLGDGYIALHPAGGMEDPKGMGIQVGICYLEEVRGGRRTGKLVKGPAGGDIQMTGYTPDVLNAIAAKSKIEFDNPSPDRARHPFNDAGGCGKYHKEFVYAGCGGPYVLLDGVTLG